MEVRETHAADWEAQRLGHVAGETEFIPAPALRA